MKYDEILAALEVRLSTTPDFPAQVVYENTPYYPTTDAAFVRTRFMPLSRKQVSCGVDEFGKPFFLKYQGIFQIVINAPESSGQSLTNEITNILCDRYEAATDIQFQDTYVTIKEVERMRGINEAPWFKTPVNIHWYSYNK